MAYIDNEEGNQVDLLDFLSEGVKTIDDFRDNPKFYVEELGRGVYPQKLINMLIDMGLVSKFSPYKSTKEEIQQYTNELDGISDERKDILSQYTSFKLTDFGKDAFDSSEERKEKISSIQDIQKETVDEMPSEETDIKEEIEEKEIAKPEEKTELSTNDFVEKTETITEDEVVEALTEENESDESNGKTMIEASYGEGMSENLTHTQELEETAVSPTKESSKIKEFEEIEEEMKSLEEEVESLGFFNRSEKKDIEKKIKQLSKKKKKLEKGIQQLDDSCPKCATKGILFDGKVHYCPTCKYWWD